MRNLFQRDDLDGALFGAGAAIGALFGIDGGEEIGDGDGAGGANLGAHHAADAAGGADLADCGALIVAGAADSDMIFDRDHADEQVRAGLGAGAAAGTQAFIHMGNAIHDGERAEFADLDAIAIAQAAVAAGFFAAVQGSAGRTGGGAVVILGFAALFAGAAAADGGFDGLGVFRCDAQVFADLSGDGSAAGDAEIGLGGAIGNGFGVVIAAGIAAGAAIGAGQEAADILHTGIDGNREEMGGDHQQNGTEQADGTNDNNTSHCNSPSLLQQTIYHTGEAHEGHRYDGGSDQSDGQALERFGDIHVLHAAANACEEDHCQQETETGAQRIDHGLAEIVLLIDIEHRDTQYGAVGGDEGQIDAEGFIQWRQELLEGHFHQLYQRGDDQDEYDGLHIAQLVLIQQIGLDGPGGGGGQYHNKGNGDAHADGGIQLFGNAEERADTQSLGEDEVLRQNSRKQNDDHFFHASQPPSLFPAEGQPPAQPAQAPQAAQSSFFLGLCLANLFMMAMSTP